jgi:RPA family protein
MMGNNQTQRYPTVRVTIGDLDQAAWEEMDKIFQTRYGPVKRVRLIGTVIDKRDIVENPQDEFFEQEKSNSRISFRLDDGTGQIWGTLWGALKQDYAHIKPGKTVLVIGSVRSYKNRAQLNIDIIIPLSNPNIETQHFLEIVRKRKLDPSYTVDKSAIKENTGGKGKTGTQFTGFDDLPEERTQNGQPDLINEFETMETGNTKKTEPPVQKIQPNTIKNEENIKPMVATEKPGIHAVKKADSPFERMDLCNRIIGFIVEKDVGDGVNKKDIAQHLNITEDELQPLLDQLVQDIKIYKTGPGTFSPY